jgi:hypothetical protein
MVFADAAARTSAIASPQEGMFSFLKDTNATQFYDGAAWVNLDTTGMVNPMTTTGDMIYSSSGTTPARLGIGTAGQVLTVNSGATAPEWATPASGSTFSGVSVYKTANQSIANTTATIVTWDAEDFDTDSYHSNVTNNSRITIPSGKTGYYQINLIIAHDGLTINRYIATVKKNGTSVLQAEASSASGASSGPTVAGILSLTAADYIEIEVYHNGGTANNLNGATAYSKLSMNYLGA